MPTMATDRVGAAGAIDGMLLVVADAARQAIPKMIAAAAIFGGVHGEHRAVIRPASFDANQGA